METLRMARCIRRLQATRGHGTCSGRCSSCILQFVDGKQNLPDLIRLCLAFGVLDIHARVARPRRFKDGMTCAVLPWRAKPFRISFSSLRSEHWPAHGAFDREFYEAVPYRTNGITNGSRKYRFAEAMSVHITAGYLNGERWF